MYNITHDYEDKVCYSVTLYQRDHFFCNIVKHRWVHAPSLPLSLEQRVLLVPVVKTMWTPAPQDTEQDFQAPQVVGHHNLRQKNDAKLAKRNLKQYAFSSKHLQKRSLPVYFIYLLSISHKVPAHLKMCGSFENWKHILGIMLTNINPRHHNDDSIKFSFLRRLAKWRHKVVKNNNTVTILLKISCNPTP